MYLLMDQRLNQEWKNGFVFNSSTGEIYVFIDGSKDELGAGASFFSSNPYIEGILKLND